MYCMFVIDHDCILQAHVLNNMDNLNNKITPSIATSQPRLEETMIDSKRCIVFYLLLFNHNYFPMQI